MLKLPKEQLWPTCEYWSEKLPKGSLLRVDAIKQDVTTSGGFAVRVVGTKTKRWKRPRWYSIGWFVKRKLGPFFGG